MNFNFRFQSTRSIQRKGHPLQLSPSHSLHRHPTTHMLTWSTQHNLPTSLLYLVITIHLIEYQGKPRLKGGNNIHQLSHDPIILTTSLQDQLPLRNSFSPLVPISPHQLRTTATNLILPVKWRRKMCGRVIRRGTVAMNTNHPPKDKVQIKVCSFITPFVIDMVKISMHVGGTCWSITCIVVINKVCMYMKSLPTYLYS